MALQLTLFEGLPKQLVVAAVESDTMVPNVRGDLDGSIQMLRAFGSHQLEFEGLPHSFYFPATSVTAKGIGVPGRRQKPFIPRLKDVGFLSRSL